MFTATAYPGTEMWKVVRRDLQKHFDQEILRFAVNQEYVVENIDLLNEDEIALFPPVSGG